MNGHKLSVRALFGIGITSALLALAVSTGLALWGVGAARESIGRAQHSYDQLALVTRLEATIGRLLVSEIKRIVDPAANRSEAEKAATEIEAALDRHIVQIRDEVQILEDEGERSVEQNEFLTAHALRALYNNMMNGIDRERNLVRGLDAGSAVRAFIQDVVAVDYAHLSRIVQTVITDERAEVREAIESIETLNSSLYNLAGIVLVTSLLLAIAGGAAGYKAVTRPLNDLTQGAAALAEGDLKHRIPAKGPNEFAALAESFNHMAERIQVHQATLAGINEKLEAAVANRTSQLNEKANQLAEIDRARRLFFAKVSHELRTPLTVLLADAEVALRQERADNASLREALEHIFAQGDFMKRRITDLINLARSEDGKIVLEESRFALNDVLRETVSAARAYAKSSNVSLELVLPRETVDFTGDRSWLRQGVLSVIDNAIKFSPSDASVRVALRASAESVEVCVEDKGPGVLKDDLPKLFDPYYQAGEGRRRGGTGLGLAVGRWVSEHHGGRIVAENSASGGLRVVMEFALAS